MHFFVPVLLLIDCWGRGFIWPPKPQSPMEDIIWEGTCLVPENAFPHFLSRDGWMRPHHQFSSKTSTLPSPPCSGLSHAEKEVCPDRRRGYGPTIIILFFPGFFSPEKRTHWKVGQTGGGGRCDVVSEISPPVYNGQTRPHPFFFLENSTLRPSPPHPAQPRGGDHGRGGGVPGLLGVRPLHLRRAQGGLMPPQTAPLLCLRSCPREAIRFFIYQFSPLQLTTLKQRFTVSKRKIT